MRARFDSEGVHREYSTANGYGIRLS